MSIAFKRLDRIWHVGALTAGEKARLGKPSLEAFCLSVSEYPADWTFIARLGGNPVWELQRPGSLWLDALALTEDDHAQIVAWALQEGLAEPATFWRAWSTDENGEWYFIRRDSRAGALYELDDPDMDGPAPDGSCVEREDGYALTTSGLAELECWRDRSNCRDGLVILYARDVLGPTEPDMVGIWWDEDYDPAMFSCPRGGVFPERVAEFDRFVIDTPEPDELGISP